ncbi:hypothetical protein [Amycolatopsis sp. CA-126428]|uniref:hypothetical protein n=1 Tax=Amycolatopsis sp. CA-126428 TaxID=2073158 RepID=UPI0018EBEB1F|nr:hypothetical protein [Amycolatopsis sp. CA-126428]
MPRSTGRNEPEFAEVGADFGRRGRRTGATLDLLAGLFRTGRGCFRSPAAAVG